MKLTNEHPLYVQITHVYNRLDFLDVLINDKLEFYDSVSYAWDDADSRVHVKVGDVVDIPEQREGVSYVRVAAIVRHRTNNGNYYVFFLLN